MGNNNPLNFINKIKDNLTEHQKDCYPAVKWLMNMGARASGRTYLMAVIAIEEAISNPGMRIIAQDHIPDRRANEYLIRMIQDILCKYADEKVRKRFTFERDSFVYCKPLEQPYLKEPFRMRMDGKWL